MANQLRNVSLDFKRRVSHAQNHFHETPSPLAPLKSKPPRAEALPAGWDFLNPLFLLLGTLISILTSDMATRTYGGVESHNPKAPAQAPFSIPPIPRIPDGLNFPNPAEMFSAIPGQAKASKNELTEYLGHLRAVFTMPLIWFLRAFASFAMRLAKRFFFPALMLFFTFYEGKIRKAYPWLPSLWGMLFAFFPMGIKLPASLNGLVSGILPNLPSMPLEFSQFMNAGQDAAKMAADAANGAADLMKNAAGDAVKQAGNVAAAASQAAGDAVKQAGDVAAAASQAAGDAVKHAGNVAAAASQAAGDAVKQAGGIANAVSQATGDAVKQAGGTAAAAGQAAALAAGQAAGDVVKQAGGIANAASQAAGDAVKQAGGVAAAASQAAAGAVNGLQSQLLDVGANGVKALPVPDLGAGIQGLKDQQKRVEGLMQSLVPGNLSPSNNGGGAAAPVIPSFPSTPKLPSLPSFNSASSGVSSLGLINFGKRA